MREDLQEWLRFIRAESHIFRDYPFVVFQQAGNAPRETGPAAAAAELLRSGRKRSGQWLRWRNKPQSNTGPLLVLRHESRVFDCSISSTAGRIATGCSEALRLWSLDTGEELQAFRNDKPWKSCALSRDGAHLLAVAESGRLVVLNVHDGSTTAEIEAKAPRDVQWLDDHRVLTIGGETVFLWDTRTTVWTTVSKEDEHNTIYDFSLSPDRRTLAIATVSGLSIRDLSTGSLQQSLHDGNDRFLSCVWVTNDTVAAHIDGGPVSLWDAHRGSLIRALSTKEVGRARAMSPDGIRLALTSGSAVEIWNTKSGELLSRVKAHTHLISSCAWSPNGDRLVTGSWDSTARVWDAETLKTEDESPRHKREVDFIAVSPDRSTVASGSDDGTVKLWNVETGDLQETLSHYGAVTGVAYKGANYLYSTAYEERPFIHRWDVRSGFESAKVPLESLAVAMDLSPDGQWIACLCADQSLRLWNTEQQSFSADIRGIGGMFEKSLCTFAPDSRRLFSVVPRNRLWVFDVVERQECFRTAEWINDTKGSELASCLRAAAFSPDGARVVAPVKGGDLQIYFSATGQQGVRLRARGRDIWTVDWSPDGRLIAAGGDERVISVWEADSGELWTRLSGHIHRVNHCAFSPVGQRLASVSLLDQQTFIWDVNEGSVLGVFQGIAGERVAWSSDGLSIAVGGDEGLVVILSLEGFPE